MSAEKLINDYYHDLFQKVYIPGITFNKEEFINDRLKLIKLCIRKDLTCECEDEYCPHKSLIDPLFFCFTNYHDYITINLDQIPWHDQQLFPISPKQFSGKDFNSFYKSIMPIMYKDNRKEEGIVVYSDLQDFILMDNDKYIEQGNNLIRSHHILFVLETDTKPLQVNLNGLTHKILPGEYLPIKWMSFQQIIIPESEKDRIVKFIFLYDQFWDNSHIKGKKFLNNIFY